MNADEFLACPTLEDKLAYVAKLSDDERRHLYMLKDGNGYSILRLLADEIAVENALGVRNYPDLPEATVHRYRPQSDDVLVVAFKGRILKEHARLVLKNIQALGFRGMVTDGDAEISVLRRSESLQP